MCLSKQYVCMNRIVFLACLAFVCLFPIIVAAQSVSDYDLDDVSFSDGAVAEFNKVAFVTYVFEAPDVSYNGVIVSGSSSIPNPEGWIKWEDQPEWHSLTFLKSKRDAPFFAGYRGERFVEGVGFILRFKGVSTQEIAISEAGVFDNRKDDDTQAAKIELDQEPTPFATSGAIIPPSLISRNEWNADPFIRGDPVPLAQPNYTRMTFHHAACCSASTYEEGLAQVKAIQNFHQDVRGWSDIGYHFLMDQEGRVYQGRPFLDNRRDLDAPPRLAQGAHVGGFNRGNIGVSMLGCYHPPEGNGCLDVLSPATKDSLIAMFAYLNENYGVETSDLFGHRDQGATSCPGDNNYALLPQMRIDIDTLVAQGNQALAQGVLDATLKENGVVLLEGGLAAIRDVDRFRVERELNGTVTTVFEGEDVEAPILFTDNSVAFGGVATYRLFATSSLGQTQGLAESSVLLFNPDEYVLGQSFPNPTSGEATIRYFIERSGIVSIRLFNLNGAEVQTLVDGFHEENRWYFTSVLNDNLASGVYYYRMTVTSFSGVIFDETRTLHVVR